VAGDDGNYTPTDQWPQCFTNPALRDQKICQLARSDPEKFVEFSQELAQKHPPSPTLRKSQKGKRFPDFNGPAYVSTM